MSSNSIASKTSSLQAQKQLPSGSVSGSGEVKKKIPLKKNQTDITQKNQFQHVFVVNENTQTVKLTTINFFKSQQDPRHESPFDLSFSAAKIIIKSDIINTKFKQLQQKLESLQMKFVNVFFASINQEFSIVLCQGKVNLIKQVAQMYKSLQSVLISSDADKYLDVKELCKDVEEYFDFLQINIVKQIIETRQNNDLTKSFFEKYRHDIFNICMNLVVNIDSKYNAYPIVTQGNTVIEEALIIILKVMEIEALDKESDNHYLTVLLGDDKLPMLKNAVDETREYMLKHSFFHAVQIVLFYYILGYHDIAIALIKDNALNFTKISIPIDVIDKENLNSLINTFAIFIEYNLQISKMIEYLEIPVNTHDDKKDLADSLFYNTFNIMLSFQQASEQIICSWFNDIDKDYNAEIIPNYILNYISVRDDHYLPIDIPDYVNEITQLLDNIKVFNEQLKRKIITPNFNEIIEYTKIKVVIYKIAKNPPEIVHKIKNFLDQQRRYPGAQESLSLSVKEAGILYKYTQSIYDDIKGYILDTQDCLSDLGILCDEIIDSSPKKNFLFEASDSFKKIEISTLQSEPQSKPHALIAASQGITPNYIEINMGEDISKINPFEIDQSAIVFRKKPNYTEESQALTLLKKLYKEELELQMLTFNSTIIDDKIKIKIDENKVRVYLSEELIENVFEMKKQLIKLQKLLEKFNKISLIRETGDKYITLPKKINMMIIAQQTYVYAYIFMAYLAESRIKTDYFHASKKNIISIMNYSLNIGHDYSQESDFEIEIIIKYFNFYHGMILKDVLELEQQETEKSSLLFNLKNHPELKIKAQKSIKKLTYMFFTKTEKSSFLNILQEIVTYYLLLGNYDEALTISQIYLDTTKNNFQATADSQGNTSNIKGYTTRLNNVVIYILERIKQRVKTHTDDATLKQALAEQDKIIQLLQINMNIIDDILSNDKEINKKIIHDFKKRKIACEDLKQHEHVILMKAYIRTMGSDLLTKYLEYINKVKTLIDQGKTAAEIILLVKDEGWIYPEIFSDPLDIIKQAIKEKTEINMSDLSVDIGNGLISIPRCRDESKNSRDIITSLINSAEAINSLVIPEDSSKTSESKSTRKKKRGSKKPQQSNAITPNLSSDEKATDDPTKPVLEQQSEQIEPILDTESKQNKPIEPVLEQQPTEPALEQSESDILNTNALPLLKSQKSKKTRNKTKNKRKGETDKSTTQPTTQETAQPTVAVVAERPVDNSSVNQVIDKTAVSIPDAKKELYNSFMEMIRCNETVEFVDKRSLANGINPFNLIINLLNNEFLVTLVDKPSAVNLSIAQTENQTKDLALVDDPSINPDDSAHTSIQQQTNNKLYLYVALINIIENGNIIESGNIIKRLFINLGNNTTLMVINADALYSALININKVNFKDAATAKQICNLLMKVILITSKESFPDKSYLYNFIKVLIDNKAIISSKGINYIYNQLIIWMKKATLGLCKNKQKMVISYEIKEVPIENTIELASNGKPEFRDRWFKTNPADPTRRTMLAVKRENLTQQEASERNIPEGYIDTCFQVTPLDNNGTMIITNKNTLEAPLDSNALENFLKRHKISKLDLTDNNINWNIEEKELEHSKYVSLISKNSKDASPFNITYSTLKELRLVNSKVDGIHERTEKKSTLINYIKEYDNTLCLQFEYLQFLCKKALRLPIDEVAGKFYLSITLINQFQKVAEIHNNFKILLNKTFEKGIVDLDDEIYLNGLSICQQVENFFINYQLEAIVALISNDFIKIQPEVFSANKENFLHICLTWLARVEKTVAPSKPDEISCSQILNIIIKFIEKDFYIGHQQEYFLNILFKKGNIEIFKLALEALKVDLFLLAQENHLTAPRTSRANLAYKKLKYVNSDDYKLSNINNSIILIISSCLIADYDSALHILDFNINYVLKEITDPRNHLLDTLEFYLPLIKNYFSIIEKSITMPNNKINILNITQKQNLIAFLDKFNEFALILQKYYTDSQAITKLTEDIKSLSVEEQQEETEQAYYQALSDTKILVSVFNKDLDKLSITKIKQYLYFIFETRKILLESPIFHYKDGYASAMHIDIKAIKIPKDLLPSDFKSSPDNDITTKYLLNYIVSIYNYEEGIVSAEELEHLVNGLNYIYKLFYQYVLKNYPQVIDHQLNPLNIEKLITLQQSCKGLVNLIQQNNSANSQLTPIEFSQEISSNLS